MAAISPGHPQTKVFLYLKDTSKRRAVQFFLGGQDWAILQIQRRGYNIVSEFEHRTTNRTKLMENKPITLLAIVAHPDDIEFLAAGSVARWVKEGARVSYCIITDGAAGSNDPDASLSDLIQERRREQTAAAACAGVDDLHFLGYQDGVLQPTLELRRDLTRIIRQIKPNRVICQDPSTLLVGDHYINHPDHNAAGEAALYAVFPSAETRPIFPELLDEGLEPHHVSELYLTLTMKPTCVVDISAEIETKIEALKCHSSQIKEEHLQLAREWDAQAAKDEDFEYGEPFRVMRLDQMAGEEESDE